MPRVMIAGDISMFTYAAQVNFNYRPHKGELNGTPFGSEVGFTMAAGVRLLRDAPTDDGVSMYRLIIGPEFYGTTVVSEGGAAWERTTTPVEVMLGSKYWITKDLKVGAGVGPGLTRGLGSPVVRTLASVEWVPAVPPSDRDGDGIYDHDDKCPDTPGKARGKDHPYHGCPDSDRDSDNILDWDDKCPDVWGVPNFEEPEKHGCPPSDRDGDKILDNDDACPDEPGPANPDPAKHGCPLRDRDGDKILDEDDACPDEPGPPNQDPKKHGCPLARIEESQIVIFERVEFEFDSDVLLKESDTILNAVKKILDEHPEFTKVSIEGHTDFHGTEEYNQDLSNRRAASVVKWMIDNGITPSRLTSVGYGEMRPIDTNETEEGRQNNRRVEFHILEKDGQPVPRVDYSHLQKQGASPQKPAETQEKEPTETPEEKE
jgi:outer membrane protein OmpA-like peptidoglycan-associated protein